MMPFQLFLVNGSFIYHKYLYLTVERFLLSQCTGKVLHRFFFLSVLYSKVSIFGKHVAQNFL